MSLDIIRFERKVFYAKAVMVTPENMAEVADWCGGEVLTAAERNGTSKYVKLKVYKTTPERQARAYAGDWVMYAGRGYKSYTQKALDLTFVAADPAAISLQEIFTSD